jgi:uncharacterized membrane protein YhdT
MKYLLIIGLVFSFAAKSTAQTYTYIPMPDSNTVWATMCYQGYMGEYKWCTYDSLTNIDTTIGSYNYNVLFDELNYTGAYRNDTLAKKVWYIPKDSITEFLIYDFSLNVGDTFVVPLNLWYEAPCAVSPITYIVTSVDTIDYMYLGKDRRVINLSYQDNFDATGKFVEGIGNEDGFLHYISWCFEFGCSLKYLVVHDSVLYGGPNDCINIVFPNSINELQANNPITIFPNPTTGSFTVQGNGQGIVTVLDIAGRTVATGKLNEEINLQGEAKGLYFIRAAVGGSVQTFKLVVL